MAQLCLRWKKKKKRSQTTLTVYATHTKEEILETISTATFLNRERQRTSQYNWCLNSGMNANALSTVAGSVLSATPALQINAGFAVRRRLCDLELDLKCVRQRSYCEGKA